MVHYPLNEASIDCEYVHSQSIKKRGSSDISSDGIVKKKKTAEQIVYLNNNK